MARGNDRAETGPPPAMRPRWSRHLSRSLGDAGVGQLLLTALVLAAAILFARLSWHVPVVGDAERIAYDLRLTAFAPRVDQDDRIALVVYNDQTLIATRKRSPLDRATLAKALRTLDTMGARSIGIDILIDQPQDEDPQLIAAFRAMHTPTWLAYANVATNKDNMVSDQQAFLDRFMAELKGTNIHPASIRLRTDSDDVARSWPAPIAGLPTLLTPAMDSRAARFAGYEGSIRYRLPKTADRPVFSELPIDLFTDSAMAPALENTIRGRDVLIGGDIVDIDRFQTPMSGLSAGAGTGNNMIGLKVHATMLAQALDGAMPPRLGNVLLWGIALLVVILAAATGFAELGWLGIGGAVISQAIVFVGAPFALQAFGYDTQFLPALGWLIGWALAFAAAGSVARAAGSEQRRFAQSALGKYLPRDIARRILDDPARLALHGERREIFVVFSDLEGFTKLSHAIEPEMVAMLLNRYLDMLSAVVLKHGGTIDKFVGDAVVAFWGAPIARPEDGANAAKAARAMWEAGEQWRNTVPPGVPPIGKTRVGLHFGAAIVGNFGGEGRIQYTALGDAMNTASRLESANKQLGSSVIASREAAERSGLDWWRPMGRVRLRGRETPVDVFEPAPDMPLEEREQLQRLFAGEGSNDDALKTIAALAERHAADAALANLLHRIKESGRGETYELA